jgi:hypothetical protein
MGARGWVPEDGRRNVAAEGVFGTGALVAGLSIWAGYFGLGIRAGYFGLGIWGSRTGFGCLIREPCPQFGPETCAARDLCSPRPVQPETRAGWQIHELVTTMGLDLVS